MAPSAVSAQMWDIDLPPELPWATLTVVYTSGGKAAEVYAPEAKAG